MCFICDWRYSAKKDFKIFDSWNRFQGKMTMFSKRTCSKCGRIEELENPESTWKRVEGD
jgi:hypothetical protein